MQNMFSPTSTFRIIYGSEIEDPGMNYDGKIFRPVHVSENGETTGETLFYYKQVGKLLSAEYAGGNIKKGHLLGIVDDNGCIHMSYHQVNHDDELMTGTCESIPQMMPGGKMRLHETWQWTSGDGTKGSSVVEEI